MPLGDELLAVGNINMDLTFYIEGLLEPDSEVFARDFMLFNGGSASNFAVGASRLGLRCGLVGCVGDDRFGVEAIKALQNERVSTGHVVIVKGERTGAVCILVGKDGGRMMVAYRGANRWLGEAVAGLSGKWPDVLQVCNVNRELLRTVLDRRSGGTLVSLDPGGSARFLSVQDLEGVDLLLLNEKECQLITREGLIGGARTLAKVVKNVVVKRGALGCLLLTDEGVEEIPAFPVDAVDTTGAGDAFDAGFVAGIVRGCKASEAARWGSAVAALKIGKKGAWTGLPSREELINFLGAH